jgi:hypothetical protein
MRAYAVIGLLWCTVAAFAADFSGTYKGTSEGQEIVVTLSQSGNTVTGEATEGELKFALRATATGNVAKGKAIIDIGGQKAELALRLTLNGTKLKAEIAESDDMADSETLELTKQADERKAVEKPAGAFASKAKFKNEASGTLKNGQEYTHASGGKFRYPKGWRVEAAEEFLQLIPNDAKENEVYGFMGAPAEGSTDPMSPDVLAVVDAGVKAQFPTARQVGKAQRITAGVGKGALVIYEANVEGETRQLRGYLTIYKDMGIALIAAGPKPTIERRDPVMREIFSTLGWGQGKTDSSLVGTWMHYGYVGGSMGGRETKMVVRLAADGTFSYSSDSEASYNTGGKDQGGNDVWSGVAYGRSGSGWKGRWTAGDGTLILHFEDGSSESFTYRLEMQGSLPVMKVTPAEGGKTLEWSKQD